MKKYIIANLLMLMALSQANADNRTIDISGNNTDKTATSYSTAITLAEGDTVNVLLARYSYFSPVMTGTGVLNLYAGGERGYLGNSEKKWNEWGGYTGDVHMWPNANNASTTSYNIVLMHGGKAFSPENIDLSKVNRSMENNRVVLHKGATLCTEANTAGSGFRIGHLETEVGSMLSGYMKNSRSAFYMLGYMNTNTTLAGTIAPSGYRDDTQLGIIKEGTGTLTITGNDNYLSGALRVMDGRVMVMNDRAAAESGKLRGALGAKPNATEAIAFVLGKGILGGTGSIGGTVDNYGTIEPGVDGTGMLTLKNYVDEKKAPNLILHPGSVIRVNARSVVPNNGLSVEGNVTYNSMTEDFVTSDKMPVIDIVVADDAQFNIGDEISVMSAHYINDVEGNWHFDIRANKYTWEVVENITTWGFGTHFLTARLVSFDNMGNNDNPDNPDALESTMGAFYDDGINDAEDMKSLRYYANQIGKNVGTAISLYKNDLTDSSLPETTAVGNNFNMLVAENEMKPEAFGGENGLFNFYTANQIVSFANRKKLVMRGHCLVWNQQSPTWISSDGGKTNDKNWTRQQALDIMKSHITNVMQQYKGKVREWDVVNECLDDNQSAVRTNPDAYEIKKNCVWQQAIGDDYIDSAFVYARQADPDAILYLNDYGVEFQGKAKSAAFYNLATRMKNNGIPIDGVGLQCHFSIDDVDSTKLDNTIRRFGEAGLLCIITELDMGIPDTSEKNLMEQARLYRIITDIMLKHDNCPSMVIWGLKDNNSWREASNPLLYNAQLEKKPAYYAVRSALRHHYLVQQQTGIQPAITTKTTTSADIYNLAGQKVNAGYKGLIIANGKKMLKK